MSKLSATIHRGIIALALGFSFMLFDCKCFTDISAGVAL